VLTRDGRFGRTLPPVTLPGKSDMLFLDDVVEEPRAAVIGFEAFFGGWGKAAILMVFRTAFSEINPLAFPSEEADLTVGTAGVEVRCCAVGSAESRSGVEGERSFVGLCVVFEPARSFVTTGRLFLGLLEGRGGRAVLGGSIGGRDETGSDVATVIDMVAKRGRDCNSGQFRFPTPLRMSRECS
jgi:hypothetical protein